MSRLIDADALRKKIKAKNASNAMMRVMKAECLAEIDDAPTIEARKKGRWTSNKSCPFCGFQPWYERDIHTLSCCPNCGADMREEGEQE